MDAADGRPDRVRRGLAGVESQPEASPAEDNKSDSDAWEELGMLGESSAQQKSGHHSQEKVETLQIFVAQSVQQKKSLNPFSGVRLRLAVVKQSGRTCHQTISAVGAQKVAKCSREKKRDLENIIFLQNSSDGVDVATGK